VHDISFTGGGTCPLHFSFVMTEVSPGSGQAHDWDSYVHHVSFTSRRSYQVQDKFVMTRMCVGLDQCDDQDSRGHSSIHGVFFFVDKFSPPHFSSVMDYILSLSLIAYLSSLSALKVHRDVQWSMDYFNSY